MNRPKKTFLKLPEYPGGKEAFKKYIKSNLVYPQKALLFRTEGIVHLTAEIDDKGNVFNVFVAKGIGNGCDEEAIRLINNIRFGGVKNRGIHVKSKRRFKIEFKLPPKLEIEYEIVSGKSSKQQKEQPEEVFSYSIQLGKTQ
jgi:TonB family protein